ncbi:MAG: TIGR03560 family F420-dependent LLM class oxidoreductase [Anaerolineae bacterium]|nr:TIGR03560 family F420-dependent LLM class oxidoreductase [Anaerolineae bacterium]
MAAIGLMLEGQMGLTWERWRRILAAAEDLDYQCVFRSDHYVNPQPPDEESLEAWVSLTYAATETSFIEFGTLVSPVTFRHPSMLVRTAAAIDDLSGGRLVFGLGAGWNEREHRAFGVPFHDRKTRFAMLKDALEITVRLLTSDKPTSYQGDHFALDNAVLLPRPERVGGPPILIGGNGVKQTLPLAAEYADEWNGVFIDPATYRERNTLLNELLDERGRAPGEVRRSLMTRVDFAKDDADWRQIKSERKLEDVTTGSKTIGGTASMVIDQIGAFIDAGAERLMLQWLHLDDMDRLEALAKDVLPHFHH